MAIEWIVFSILLYLAIGNMLEGCLSKNPNLWGVLLWPVILVGVIILWLKSRKGLKRHDGLPKM